MRRFVTFVAVVAGAGAIAPLGGCARTAPPVEWGTVRVFGSKRVSGHYVSPSAYAHYLGAQLASQDGDSEAAVDELRRALASDGASAYLRTRLAEELLALGRLDEARQELESALAQEPDLAEAHVDMGRIHLQLGDAPAAERAFRRAIEVDKGCEAAYLALAELLHNRGERERADEVHRLLAERVPDSADAHVRLARVASRRGDLARAEAELTLAVDLDPGLTEACRELGELLIGDGRAEAAARKLRRCWNRSADAGVAGLLVTAEAARGRADAADDLLDKLVARGGSVEQRVAVGWLLVERRQGARAVALVEAAARAFPAEANSPALVLLRGAALDATGGHDAAAEVLRKVPPEAPEFVRAQLRLARILADKDRLADAVAGLERAAPFADKLDGGDAITVELAELHERAGDRNAALRVLQGGLTRRPQSEALSYALGRHLGRAGDWEQAVAAVRPVLRRSPESVEAMNFIGYTLVEHGQRLDEARKLLETASGLRPGSGDVADSLGWLYFKLGRLGDAEKLLVRASRLVGDSAEVLSHLAAVYLKKGDRARALDAYRRAIALRPDEKLRHTVEQQLILLEDSRTVER